MNFLTHVALAEVPSPITYILVFGAVILGSIFLAGYSFKLGTRSKITRIGNRKYSCPTTEEESRLEIAWYEENGYQFVGFFDVEEGAKKSAELIDAGLSVVQVTAHIYDPDDKDEDKGFDSKGAPLPLAKERIAVLKK